MNAYKQIKIYVLGALAGKKKDYIISAKKLGIDEENLEFYDYGEVKNLNPEKLRCSSSVSDVICGSMPHSVVGKGDYSSLIALLKDNPNEYPKVYLAVANDCLKLNINNFRQGLLQSRYKEKFG